MKTIATLLLFLLSPKAFGQVIIGDVKFENDEKPYNLISIKSGHKRSGIDESGKFMLAGASTSDTVDIIPIPEFVKVKIYNLPEQFDTLELKAIPLFENVDREFPIINFKSKKASRKYFRKLEKEFEIKKAALEQRIDSSRYLWNGKEYPLKSVSSSGGYTVLIDLAN